MLIAEKAKTRPQRGSVNREGMFQQALDMPPVPDTNRYIAFALPKEDIE
ncbi:hypothetical protein [Hyphococcus luteus]|nr:hypothetical protein [Marinicaulis flavus]